MGLYDTIDDNIFCPFYGEINTDFQTKDLGCLMVNDWTVEEIRKFTPVGQEVKIYTHCIKCGKWIEIIIQGEAKDLNSR